MGIKDLSKYIRENTNAYTEYHLSAFAGKRVAVDISVFLYKTIRTMGEENWMLAIIYLLISLKKYGIKIVCVFDGPNAPPEKLKERAKRKETADKVREKTEEIRRLIKKVKEYMKNDYVELPLELRSKIREACKRQRDANKFDAIDYRDINAAMKALKMCEEKFAKQCISITTGHADEVKEIVKHLGMAVMQADGEAETMCAYMCVKGMVDGVLTEDTDVLAYGTPLFMCKLDTKTEKLMVIHHDVLLEEMNMTFQQFQDFCIMCSCDYNDRIKLVPKKPTSKPTGIGPSKAYKLLMEHGSIDNIEYMTELDTTPLNYERCRQLFTIPSIYDDLVLPYNRPMDLVAVEKFLTKHRCKFMLEKVKEAWAPTPIQFVGSDDEDQGDSDETFEDRGNLDESSEEEIPYRRLLPPQSSQSPKEQPRMPLVEPRKRLLPSQEVCVEPSDEESFEQFDIYSDGSCMPNPGPGGWATLVIHNGVEKILKGGSDKTTNNRMELKAALEGLKYVDSVFAGRAKINFTTDSEYVKNGITMWIKSWKMNGWKTKSRTDVKNSDLWKSLDRLNLRHNVKWEWVKAHNDHPQNERCDFIAKQQARKQLSSSHF